MYFRCNPCFLHRIMNIIRFIKNWTLPIAMAMGVILYFVYVNIPFLEPTKPFVEHAVAVLQPLLIFLMLFLTFCKVDVSELKPCKWHVVLLLIQSLSFIFLAGILYIFPDMRSRILIEGAYISGHALQNIDRGSYAVPYLSYSYCCCRSDGKIGGQCRTSYIIYNSDKPCDSFSCSIGGTCNTSTGRSRIYIFVSDDSWKGVSFVVVSVYSGSPAALSFA